ncbi:MAG: type IV secretory system conjugative DNA transfer family protein [Xanthomarina gelatinilytica]|uniref:type IV secretory system conjugative DNA transfer family protein n=1 Tax=Xanthomarina gelatinilytica TaxID=1137281 RepID=UPI003A86F568
MGLTRGEQATLNFYNWEYRFCGYYHFDTPIDIEVPYVSFQHVSQNLPSIQDDGRAPTLFKQVTKLLAPPKEEAPEEDLTKVEPRFLEVSEKPQLIGLSISFPSGTEINPSRNIELLNLLSFTEYLMSFEIIGNSDTIQIQMVCSEQDRGRLESQLLAYFPTVIIKTIEVDDFGFSNEKDIAITDFGLESEYMRSIVTTDSFSIDPLTSVMATMETLHDDDVAVFQILFKGISSPLAKDTMYSVNDGAGGSFFSDAPEMPQCAKEKISNPLFSVVIRIATQGSNDYRSQYLVQELARSISAISTSQHNKLIPLSNKGYDYDFHKYNLHHRLSNRLGFVLNSKELNTFLHYPNKTVVSKKLQWQVGKTKRIQQKDNQGVLIGVNTHNQEDIPVQLSYETRLSHTYVIGATGVGKSTLLANMMLADIENGMGCAMFDPHGDIIDDILERIPENRINDVVLIDPSDADFPIGFNLLEAHTDAEKIVLSSDLVSAFKRHATAWGDNMTAVLQNAVNTMLESTQGGTLIELKRFLLEEPYRAQYLKTVNDPSLHYYWNNEYPLVRKGIAPLLTRIDTFLRPKLVRYMLAQNKGVDVADCLNTNKIVLLKLSQGLIGEQNSYLLGSLFLAKFNQSALARQSKDKDSRKPFMLYLDEFQNFITPSIERILSGARKYGLGITIAHQELAQIEDTKLLNSVLSNPKTRICFRLGDTDAKRLESGFSYFEQSDLQSLGRGEAIMRIGSSTNDFNLNTYSLSENKTYTSEDIVANVRNTYATPRKEVEAYLIAMLPSQNIKPKKVKKVVEQEDWKEKPIENKVITEETPQEPSNNSISEKQRELLVQQENESLETRAHTYLQSIIKKLGQDRNYKATKEHPTKDGGRIDMVLEQDGLKIAFEISETNKPAYEVKNIKKCLKAGCIPVVMVSKNKNHLKSIEKLANKELSEKDKALIQYLQPDDISNFLDDFVLQPTKNEEVIKGFRIITEYDDEENSKIANIKSRLAQVFKRKK